MENNVKMDIKEKKVRSSGVYYHGSRYPLAADTSKECNELSVSISDDEFFD
jgi:hypothetical protein